MILRDWEIWYSYSTYFLEEFQDLGSIAKSLIQCDLCTVVQSSYGIVWWKEDGEVKEQELKVERDKTGSEAKSLFQKVLLVMYARHCIKLLICAFMKNNYLIVNISKTRFI